MPDLATHVLVPLTGMRLIEIGRRKMIVSGPMRYIFALGCIFPDLIDKAVPYTIDYLYLFVAGSRSRFPSLEYLQSPIMLLLCLYIFSLLFAFEYRKKIFLVLSTGASIHLALDLLQGNICSIGYLWLFPFSFKKPTIVQLFYDDQTSPLVPFFIAFFFVSEGIYRFLCFLKKD